MISDTNVLTVPEIRHHRREVHEGVTIITYEVRRPGECSWTPVKVFRPTEPVTSEQEAERSWQTPNHSRR